MPYLMRPSLESDGIVQEYSDPTQRMVVQQETIDQRVNVRDQYKNQVFRPGHNLPTMSLEELAEQEMHDAMERQRVEQEQEQLMAEEDPDSEAVLERERLKKMQHEDWADFVPKGRGITKKI